ncbi:MAG: hypothetical protein R6U98_26275 [Pirellulaceae bacterium]
MTDESRQERNKNGDARQPAKGCFGDQFAGIISPFDFDQMGDATPATGHAISRNRVFLATSSGFIPTCSA